MGGQSRTRTDKLRAVDGDGGDLFGSSVALSGDTALVGARGRDGTDGENAGAAYVFERSDGTWNRWATLRPDDLSPGDRVGNAVALDGTTALLGGPGDDNENGGSAGAVYAFERSNGTWDQRATLLPDDGNPGDVFGWSVALDGDAAVVGAPGDDAGGTNVGAAYAFERAGGTWHQRATLVPDDAAPGDGVGNFVALDGDTALVGAPDADGANGSDSGAAYVFERANGAWTRRAKLEPEDGRPGDHFGFPVAVEGNRAVVGARRHDRPVGRNAGAAYVFDRFGGDWTQRAKLMAGDGASGDGFATVAVSGNVALVGARGDNNPNGRNVGGTYVFELSNGTWAQRGKLLPHDGVGGDGFGSTVAMEGTTALVAAPHQDNANGAVAGAAYAFDVGGILSDPGATCDLPPAAVAADRDGDCAIDISELRDSIQAWAADRITTTELRAIIRAWARTG